VAHDTDSQWEDELTKLQLEHQAETEKLLNEIAKLGRQAQLLEKEVTPLSFSLSSLSLTMSYL
jgi:hypothetical protein